jgi:hypothetical protein
MDRIKYPRTMNFPWSGSNSSDDVWWKDATRFKGKRVIMTEKMDGECTTIYPDSHVHARSVDTDRHPSRTWVKQIAASFAYELPETMRMCGENVYAYHSIFYTELPSYFLAFGIYDGDTCISWDEMKEFCEILGVHTVPVLYDGIWDEDLIRGLWAGKGAFPTFETAVSSPKFPDDFSPCEAEGYVVRLAEAFHYEQFAECVAKYVRKDHVKTSEHWLSKPVFPNLLAADAQG